MPAVNQEQEQKTFASQRVTLKETLVSTIDLNHVVSMNNVSVMNSNFDIIEAAINGDVIHKAGGQNVMGQDLDMNGHVLLNLSTNPSNPGSPLTVGIADSRYYKQHAIPAPSLPADAVPKSYIDALNLPQGTFTQAATGATSRTWTDKVGEKISVKDFGAVGNGVVDDTAAIQKAIDAVVSKQLGGVVELMDSHLVSVPIVLKSGVRLSGRGPAYAGGTAYSAIPGTYLKASASFVGDAVIVSAITGPDNVLTACQLEQLRIDLSLATTHGIHLQSIYDGVILRNVHVVGTEKTKRAFWADPGAYGLGQSLLAENCQFLTRDNSDGTVAPVRLDALNESTFIGCKFFGASGGINASLGACVELSGCGGVLFDGCSYAFGDVGASLVDHATKKNYGVLFSGCTFESLRTSALKVRSGSTARRATQVYLRSPRLYDSVFTMTNAIDIDFCEQSVFECSFKKAIVGSSADQNTIHIQRQNFVTDTGTNTMVFSQQNASDPYYGIKSRIRAIGGIQSDGTADLGGGIGYFIRTFSAATGTMSAFDSVLLVNRATSATYTLPVANAFGAGRSQMIRIRSIGTAAVTFNVSGSDTVDGAASTSLAAGAKLTLVSDGVSAWYSV